MVEWENDDKDAHPSSPAEKEILIFQVQRIGKGIRPLYCAQFMSIWEIE